ncbi:hypothetical protein ACO2Q3_15445 [Caulobacter sp. KR2-114]|uniref:hypothetical protein n=1 Tax=Caulobacter sp. KR2-114 TaxID=3400912 RepID=UPI003C0FEA65
MHQRLTAAAALLLLAACGRGGEPAATTATIGPAPAAPRPVAYSAVGGADDFHGTGVICDLAKPFVISGGGVKVSFTPSDARQGAYVYGGALMGFAVKGAGTYKVTLKDDGSGGRIEASGPGSVKTPMGVKTSGGSEVYVLTRQAEPCDPAAMTLGAATAATDAPPTAGH